MRYAALLLALFFTLSASAQIDQFRMVGSGSWGTVDDSTHFATVTFSADLTANSFIPTGITDTMRLFTQRGQLYRIDSVGTKTFSTAVLYVVELGGDWGKPSGQVMVYEARGRETVPAVPFSSNGATAKLQEAVITHNSEKYINLTRSEISDSVNVAKNYADIKDAALSARLDEVDSAKDTINQVGHGFSVGDPLWKSGDYVLALDTGLSVTVSGIVSDSINANFFTVQRFGHFTLTGHGFTVDQQLYVQPDGSYSAADTVNSLVYGFAIDANTIQIGVKPAAVLTLANAYDNTATGLPPTKKGAIDALGKLQSFANASSISSSTRNTGIVIFNREKYSYYEITTDTITGFPVDEISQITMSDGKYARLKDDMGKVRLSWFVTDTSQMADALQRAINYAYNLPGITPSVLVDYDTIYIRSQITMKEQVVIEGTYIGGQIETGTAADEPLIGTLIISDLNNSNESLFITDSLPSYTTAHGLRNINISAISPARAAIEFIHPRQVVFNRVSIDGNRDSLFFKYGVINCGSIDSKYERSWIAHCEIAAFWNRETNFQSTTTELVGMYIKRPTIGIYLDSLAGSLFLRNNTIIEGCDSVGIIVEAATLFLERTYFESNPVNIKFGTKDRNNGSRQFDLYATLCGFTGISPADSDTIIQIDYSSTVVFFACEFANEQHSVSATSNTNSIVFIGGKDWTTNPTVNGNNYNPANTSVQAFGVDNLSGTTQYDNRIGKSNFFGRITSDSDIETSTAVISSEIKPPTNDTLIGNFGENMPIGLNNYLPSVGLFRIDAGNSTSYTGAPLIRLENTNNGADAVVGIDFIVNSTREGVIAAQSSGMVFGDASNRFLQLHNSGRFRAYQYNNPSFTRAALFKTKGTYPYLTISSDGTITNETSIPATDISSSGDSSNVQLEITGLDSRLDAVETNYTTGTATPTTDLGGEFSITHGLGATPTHVSVSNESGTEYTFEVVSRNSTTFVVKVYDGTGTSTTVNSTGVSITWAAFK